MNITNCTWEIANIGKKTVELSFSVEDKFDAEAVNDAVEGYEYLVAKVHCGNIACLLGLQEMGFKMIETQLNISKKYKDFNFDDRLVRMASKGIKVKPVDTEDKIHRVMENMTTGMFTTDRVYLDPKLGPELGLQRYRNWLYTEYMRGTTAFTYENAQEMIGFGLNSYKGDEIHGLLGGIFEKYQAVGNGMLTACGSFLFARDNDKPFKIMKTSISSNNMPVVQFYNYLGFKLDSMTYVMVKHR